MNLSKNWKERGTYGLKRFSNRHELSNRLDSNAKINTWDIKPKKRRTRKTQN